MMNGQVKLIGDSGNPDDTGEAKLVVNNLESADVATALTDMDTFADSLKSGSFTGCNVADVSVTETTPQYQSKPATGINIDRQLVVLFRKKTEPETRKLTISGIATGSSVLEQTAQGERLTAAGKVTLAGYLDTLFGWTTEAVVKSGKVIQKY